MIDHFNYCAKMIQTYPYDKAHSTLCKYFVMLFFNTTKGYIDK